ncbi:NAD(P)/FAD-dependent oxidoreductase [Schumannella sp. 10F1B-5-1]|uniref:NAD(P)/FAD-dependent oxidoreductase n=1 Tax=Schumannella sp. 10F1B-5-1 TaxID=2590780 RepID=UPI0011312919|nr:NAD(P)/FAD-dependent oxidoreductase [Schumannella sp. 10F1B-5-1]TPW71551.1 NAD(P)/FAD-dependent oxidoreductase [Schumannella sp. 10F1B-5-1]
MTEPHPEPLDHDPVPALAAADASDLWDAVVIGGGAAGLNAALMLARSRRRVLVVDAGSPRNRFAEGVHGLLAREGTPPAELLARGRAEVQSYGGVMRSGRVRSVSGADGAFAVEADALEAAGGEGRASTGPIALAARQVIVAAGVSDALPDISGLAELWGSGVLHCPYCHGWEVRDRRIAVLAQDPAAAVHQAQLFRQLSAEVVVLQHSAAPFGDVDARGLAARGIRVIPGEVVALEQAHGDANGDADADAGSGRPTLNGARLANGTVVPIDALVVASVPEAHLDFLAPLGLGAEPHPSGRGQHLPTTPFGVTSVPGLWAAGNATDLMAQVGAAAATGAMVGAQVNAALVAAEVAAAVEGVRTAS